MRFVLGRLKTRNDVLLDSLICSGSIGNGSMCGNGDSRYGQSRGEQLEFWMSDIQLFDSHEALILPSSSCQHVD